MKVHGKLDTEEYKVINRELVAQVFLSSWLSAGNI